MRTAIWRSRGTVDLLVGWQVRASGAAAAACDRGSERGSCECLGRQEVCVCVAGSPTTKRTCGTSCSWMTLALLASAQTARVEEEPVLAFWHTAPRPAPDCTTCTTYMLCHWWHKHLQTEQNREQGNPISNSNTSNSVQTPRLVPVAAAEAQAWQQQRYEGQLTWDGRACAERKRLFTNTLRNRQEQKARGWWPSQLAECSDKLNGLVGEDVGALLTTPCCRVRGSLPSVERKAVCVLCADHKHQQHYPHSLVP
jgi:hypothetical protein